MKKMKTLRKAALTLVVSSVLASSPCFAADTAPKGILAEVGPYKLTVQTFENQIRSLPPQMQMALEKSPQMREQFLERWVNMILMAQEARRLKLDESPEVKARFEDLKNALLAQEYLREKIEKEVPKVTDAEIDAYYKEHKQDFTIPESVRARHILIRVESGANEKTWEAAKKKIEGIRARIVKGEDFAKLAKEYSEDPGTKDKGGELGYFTKGRMVPEFEKAAFALKTGEISQPIKTAFGYHLIEVEDKKPAQTRTLDQVKANIKQLLENQKQQQRLEELVKQLEAKTPVKVYKENLPKVEEPANPHAMPMH